MREAYGILSLFITGITGAILGYCVGYFAARFSRVKDAPERLGREVGRATGEVIERAAAEQMKQQFALAERLSAHQVELSSQIADEMGRMVHHQQHQNSPAIERIASDVREVLLQAHKLSADVNTHAVEMIRHLHLSTEALTANRDAVHTLTKQLKHFAHIDRNRARSGRGLA